MSELASLLCEIVRAEYAQWMRYTYLSALRFGPFADALVEHFYEHAENELEHAAIISRWIVDLGGAPPTDMAPVEPFDGTLEEALEWLMEAEIDGINKYQIANELSYGIAGLQNDIGEISSSEHEHLSDLMKWLDPAEVVNNDVIVVIAKTLKSAASARELIDWLKPLMANYIREYKDEPLEVKNIALELIESHITENLWPRRNEERVKQELRKFKQFYEWIKDASGQTWLDMLEMISPEKRTPFKEMLQGIEPAPELKLEPESKKIEIPKQVEQAPIDLRKQEIQRQIEELDKQLGLTKKPESELVQFPTRGEEATSSVLVYDVGKGRSDKGSGKQPTVKVGVGDKIKNISLNVAGMPPPGRPGRSQYNEGIIDEIMPNGLISVTTGAGKQRWDPATNIIEIDAKGQALSRGAEVMHKEAIDQTAKEYWANYFKDYGEMWVRDIPRRIKQAIRRDIKANELDGYLAPLAYDVSSDNTLSVEAAFVGKVDGTDSKILVTASFNHEGRMESIDTTVISKEAKTIKKAQSGELGEGDYVIWKNPDGTFVLEHASNGIYWQTPSSDQNSFDPNDSIEPSAQSSLISDGAVEIKRGKM